MRVLTLSGTETGKPDTVKAVFVASWTAFGHRSIVLNR